MSNDERCVGENTGLCVKPNEIVADEEFNTKNGGYGKIPLCIHHTINEIILKILSTQYKVDAIKRKIIIRKGCENQIFNALLTQIGFE